MGRQQGFAVGDVRGDKAESGGLGRMLRCSWMSRMRPELRRFERVASVRVFPRIDMKEAAIDLNT
jgi:hypothetical protein